MLSVLAGVSGPTSRCVRAGGFSPRLWLGGEEAQQPECAVVHLAAHQSQGKSLKTRPGRGSNQSDGDDLAEMTKRQLYELAQDLGVERRRARTQRPGGRGAGRTHPGREGVVNATVPAMSACRACADGATAMSVDRSPRRRRVRPRAGLPPAGGPRHRGGLRRDPRCMLVQVSDGQRSGTAGRSWVCSHA